MSTQLIRTLYKRSKEFLSSIRQPVVIQKADKSIGRKVTNSKLLRTLQTPHPQILRMVKPKVVFVLGGPGAGKGTQCQNIVNKYGFVHLSAGDLLREERSREGSEFKDLIETCIKDGEIVPVEVTCSLLENAMNMNMKNHSKYKFLIDGFPRNQDNLDGWTRKMSDKVDLLFILFFDCPDNVCVSRCLSRGASGSGRSDDNEQSLQKRIQTYRSDSLPIIEHYKQLDLVRTVNAGPSASEVFVKVQEVFDQCKAMDAGDQ